jgi:hypothetical protein
MSETLTKDDIEILTNVMPELTLTPSNMPKLEQIDQWQARVGKSFHKIIDKDGKVDGRLFFVIDNLWPDTDVAKNRVTYRYHVYTHFGYAKDRDGALQDGRQDRKLVMKLAKHDFFIDVDKFLKEYKEA